MKRTKLYDEHINLGAKMVPFANYEMPIQYSSVKDEIYAVRKSCGVFDVSHMGEFFIEGRDTIEAIDYILPNDFNQLPVGKAMYSPLLDEQGLIIDDLIVYKLSDSKALVCVNAANIQKDFDWISSQVKRFDVQLKDQSDLYSLLAVQGPESVSKLGSIFKNDLNLSSVPTYGVIEAENGIIIARTGYTGEDGFEIFGDHQSIKEIWIKLIESGVKPCGLASRDTLRLEACYPLYGQELNQTLNPFECGLKWTVKMNKESFVGKNALEKPNSKYKLVKFYLEKGIPRTHSKILSSNDESLGEVTSGTFSPIFNKGIGMGLIKNDCINANGDLLIEIRGKKYPATLIKRNFLTLDI